MELTVPTTNGAEAQGLKVCPHCGELLFADMDVCYGCLYDFRSGTREEAVRAGVESSGTKGATAGVLHHDPLAMIDLDEVDLDEAEPAPCPASEPDATPPVPADQEKGERVPRHRKTLASADETLDLGRQQAMAEEPEREPHVPAPLDVVVVGKEMEVRLPLVASGLAVGRGEDNDIILRSRLVSRHHLRILPIEGGAAVEDCGATNPAELRGIPLEGTRPMRPGDELRVCDTLLTLAASA